MQAYIVNKRKQGFWGHYIEWAMGPQLVDGAPYPKVA